MKMLLQTISDANGLHLSRYDTVPGGDINYTYCLHGADTRYFLKVNDAHRYPGMFEKEANGLNALHKHTSLRIPTVITAGISGTQQYLLLEWIEKGSPQNDCWKNFGAALALMHQQPQKNFGWQEDNYIGSLIQINTKYETWHLFYAACRIIPLVKILADTAVFSKQDIARATLLCNKLDQFFPEEPPALLHGDLWAGNYIVTTKGDVALYDPAIYCGHREMDLGMSKLFGGFDPRFYEAYNEVYPLEKNWQQRLPLTQLYPLLVHAVLFGGHYVNSAKDIIRQFV
ncbi:MAG TPA: fructosamine kinase family protein [Chitinophagaceae bacterium]